MQNIIIATIKEWNISNYFKLKERYKDSYNFHLVTTKDELTKDYVEMLSPKYIFFPHWSWIIPKTIYANFESIVFHMTDLPYGRGGSPFQNLIINGVYNTKISALQVNDGLDTGDIYLKVNFNIAEGSAQENFLALSNIIFEKMIPKFLNETLVAFPQEGNIVQFKRRIPQESNIELLKNVSMNKLYDFIRMLDGEGYPKAFHQIENIKIEYFDVKRENGKLTGNFTILETKEKIMQKKGHNAK